MKILHTSLLVVSLASCPVFLPAAAAKEEVVINFLDMPRSVDGTYEKSYQYAFGDWEKKAVQTPGKGLLVYLTGSKGGVGDNRGIDFGKLTKARITFIIGNRNRATSFIFTLVDRDGTDQSFDVSLENRPRGVERKVTVDLSKPSRENKPGGTPGLNLKKLETWQLTGNFQTEPLEILFLRVDAVSE
jgi:hypothetical protein